MSRKCPVGFRKVRSKCVRVQGSVGNVPASAALIAASVPLGIPGVPFAGLGRFADSDPSPIPPHGYMVLARVKDTNTLAATVGKGGSVGLPGAVYPRDPKGVPVPPSLVNINAVMVQGAASDGWTFVGGKLDFVGRYTDPKFRVWSVYVLRGGVAVANSTKVRAVRSFEVINKGPQFIAGDVDYVAAIDELVAIGDAEAREKDFRARGEKTAVAPIKRVPKPLEVERMPSREIALEQEAERQWEAGEGEEGTSLDPAVREETEDPTLLLRRGELLDEPKEETGDEMLVDPTEFDERAAESDAPLMPDDTLTLYEASRRGIAVPLRRYRMMDVRVPTMDYNDPKYRRRVQGKREWLEKQRAQEESIGEEMAAAIERARQESPEAREAALKARQRAERARVRAEANQTEDIEEAKKFDKTDIERADFFRIYPGEEASDKKVSAAPYLVYFAKVPMPQFLKRGEKRYTKVESLPNGKVTYRRDDVPAGAPFTGLRGVRAMRTRAMLAGLGVGEDADDDAPVVRAPTRRLMVAKSVEEEVDLPGIAPVVVEQGTIPAFAPTLVGGQKRKRTVTALDLLPYKVPGREIAGRQIVRMYYGGAPFPYPIEFSEELPDRRVIRFKKVDSSEVDERGRPLIVYTAVNPSAGASAAYTPIDTVAPKKREVRVLDYPDAETFAVNKANIENRPRVAPIYARQTGRSILLETPWEMDAPYSSELVVRPGHLKLSDRAGLSQPFDILSGTFTHQRLARGITFDGMASLGRVRATLNVEDVRNMDLLRPSVPVRWGRKFVDSDGVLIFTYELARDMQAWMGKLANERLGKLNGLGEGATCFRLYHGSPASGLDLTGYAKPLFFTENRRVAAAYAKRQVIGTSNVIGTTPTVYVVEVCPTKLLDTRMPAHLELANERLQSYDPEDRPRIDFDWGTRGSTGFPVHSLRLPLLKVLPDFDAFYIDEGTQGWSVMVRPGAGNFRVVGVEPA